MVIGGLILGLVRTISRSRTPEVDAAARLPARAISGSSRARTSSTAATCCRWCRSSRSWPRRRWSRASACCGATRFRASCRSALIVALVLLAVAPPVVHVDQLRRQRRQGRGPTGRPTTGFCGSCRRGRRSPREARCDQAAGRLSRQLREAAASRRRSSPTRHRHPVSRRLLAGLRAVPREPADVSPPNTRTISGSSRRPDEVARFTPASDHPGPELSILKVKP